MQYKIQLLGMKDKSWHIINDYITDDIYSRKDLNEVVLNHLGDIDRAVSHMRPYRFGNSVLFAGAWDGFKINTYDMD